MPASLLHSIVELITMTSETMTETSSCAAPVGLARRRFLASAVALPACCTLPTAWAQETSLKICQTTALSGPLGDLGSALHQGAMAAFHAINTRGGVHGRQIKLETLDDAYEVPKAMLNLEKFLNDSDCFALFNCFGTPMVEEMMPRLKDGNMPFFTPLTGGQVSRVAGARHAFNIRASYADEAERLVQHLATIGIRRIGIAYQNNTFGREVFAGAEAAMRRAKLPDAISTTVESNAADAAKAAALLAESNPEAVLVGLAGKPGLELIKEFRKLRRGVSLYALSVLGTSANIKALGADALGMAISQVVPLPTNSSTAVARDFVKALKNFDAQATPSHLALEGYINARTFAEILQRAGKGASRSAFMDASWGLKKWDLGGFEIHATTPDRSASRFVELTVVGRDGRLIR